MPKISIIIPYHDTRFTTYFLARLLNSISNQTSVETPIDYEIILVKEGLPGKTINAGIKRAKGELIKIICMDDWFAPSNALENIIKNFKGNWQICGSHDNPNPTWTDKVPYGNNTLGGLSSITMKNEDPVLFDEEYQWMIDVDFYARAFKKWGEPSILNGVVVNIGLGDHQLTRSLSDELKQAEIDKLFNQLPTKSI